MTHSSGDDRKCIFFLQLWGKRWETLIVVSISIITILITFFCDLKSNVKLDIIATVIAIIILFSISRHFINSGERGKGYFYFAISLVIATLVILFGVVIYSPERQSLPVDGIQVCGCAISLQQSVNKTVSVCEHMSSDSTKGNKRPDGILLEKLFNSDIKNIFEQKCFQKEYKDQYDEAIISYKEMLSLCCAEDSKDFVFKLNKIKKDKLEKMNNMECNRILVESFLLDEIAINILQEALTNCSCSNCNCRCNCNFKKTNDSSNSDK